MRAPEGSSPCPDREDRRNRRRPEENSGAVTPPAAAWWLLWAKTERGGDRWHRLPYHLLDVAATAEVLWERLPDAARSVPLGLSDNSDECRRIVVFLAAAHDVGKANPFFQYKDARRATALELTDPGPEKHGHGYASGVFLKAWLSERWGWGGMAAANVAKAVGGHHGSFFQDVKAAPLRLDQEPWQAFGPRLLNDLAEVLDAPPKIREPKDLNAFLAWIAGFVCVADWLGSHETMTVWETGDRPLLDYLAEARGQAKRLFANLDWIVPSPTESRPVEELVPTGRNPNELQRLAERVAAEGFGLAIVEAPTGEGKTEAAFALAEPARSAGGGVCFFLPTMATANGLYPRVRGFLADDVRLAHSQAWLYRDAGDTVPNPGDEESQIEAEDWLAGSKRTLLAPYTVGTIDQGLMGALRVKHGFVRLFALAGKVVVVDEVHAYDVYMSDLLETLLGWLRALGCQVVLLSATLPAARRAALFKAWGAEPGEAEEYPCLSWTEGDGAAHSEGFGVSRRKPLALRLREPTDAEAWEQGASRILDRVREHGGLGALVLNTVGGAQSAYDWLRRAAEGAEIDVLIFHVRYTAEDRKIKENKVLARFGKEGLRDRPAILVATQVVEQSLDLDFDHMVSALAPIDLLIQRAGRLHRHRRHVDGTLCAGDEPDARPNPVLEVLPPAYDEDNVPDLREPVYARDLQMATIAYLREGVVIAQPKDVATAVEAVYGSKPAESARESWLARFVEASEREASKRQRMSEQAEEVVIPAAMGEEPLTRYGVRVVEDDTPGSAVAAKTRLEDLPSLTLAVLREGDPSSAKMPNAASKEKIALRCVRVSAAGKRYAELVEIERAKGWRKVKALREARPIVLDTGGCFITPSYVYHYDVETGLKWVARDA